MNELDKYTDEQLSDELIRRSHKRKDQEYRSLSIQGFAHKDFLIRYFSDPAGVNDEYYYSLYLTKDGEEYDIYYDFQTYGRPDEILEWWPKELAVGPDEDGSSEYYNLATRFVPRFFRESSENIYRSQFSLEETIKKLKDYGFVVSAE